MTVSSKPSPSGTAEDALAQARRYREAGASELVLTFAGRQPEPDMQYLANAARIGR
jgi:biotin synthase-like enzyme